jgi:hypothetical protein
MDMRGFLLVRPDPASGARSTALGVAFRTIDRPKLQVSWSGGETRI